MKPPPAREPGDDSPLRTEAEKDGSPIPLHPRHGPGDAFEWKLPILGRIVVSLDAAVVISDLNNAVNDQPPTPGLDEGNDVTESAGG